MSDMVNNWNQCSGCIQGYPIVMGIHRLVNGDPYVCCTKSKYIKSSGIELSNEQKEILKDIALGLCDTVSHNRELLYLQAKGYTVVVAELDSIEWHLTTDGEYFVRSIK